MNKTFLINGGAGRVIAAIPALEKFARENPENDFRVLMQGWDLLYWSHPLLQEKSFSANDRGAFEHYVRNNDLICPEPYYLHDYYNQRISIAEGFNEIINNTKDHSDLDKPNLYLSGMELSTIRNVINQLKNEKKKSKLVVFQPYGSNMISKGPMDRPYDKSQRSLDVDDYLKIVQQISSDAVVIFFGPKELRHPMDNVSADLSSFNPDLRMFMSFISQCDLFVGCDSVGQHMARAFDKEGVILMGSTFETNVSYPNFDGFTFWRKEGIEPDYTPIRIAQTDCDFSERVNDGILELNDKELKEIIELISSKLYS
jgi:hypothetical protein